MNISARNVLKGKVVSITSGVVNTEVVIELSGGSQIVSIISKISAEKLGLRKGRKAYAVIKASNVMLATD
ncbi:MAG: transporter [Gammaproteobacteria bacterium RBG_16_51_14]|nr:MAG: transporter [Gammaproteobacteria bacterium RBG_16_51_14]